MAHGEFVIKKGNPGLHVQAFTCLEDLTSECYENEVITFGNPAFPTRESLQHLVDDYYFSLTFTANIGDELLCACCIFLPVPTPAQLVAQEFEVSSQPLAVNKSQVQFDGARNNTDKKRKCVFVPWATS